jgi:acyl-ACP thioesterase
VPSAAPAVELLPCPPNGRIYSIDAAVRLGDVDRNGRMRLDATARFMQDVATDDASDAGLDRTYGWLVRRTLIEATQPARLGERLAVSTWCAGIGRSWAERRTQIVGDRGASIDAASLWVQVDVRTGRPARVATDFLDAYASTAAGRTVSARLALPRPDSGDVETAWAVRRTDLDPFGHVNNAATWAFLEEAGELDTSERVGRAEMEYLQPVEPDERVLNLVTHVDDAATTAWLVSESSVRAAARWTPGRD